MMMRLVQSRKDLIRHIEAIHMNNLYECPECGSPYKTKNALQNHNRKAHNKGKRKDYMNGLNKNQAQPAEASQAEAEQ